MILATYAHQSLNIHIFSNNVQADSVPYLLKYKSQLQCLFLLLLSRVCLTLQISRLILHIYAYTYMGINFLQYVLGVRLILQQIPYSLKFSKLKFSRVTHRSRTFYPSKVLVLVVYVQDSRSTTNILSVKICF